MLSWRGKVVAAAPHTHNFALAEEADLGADTPFSVDSIYLIELHRRVARGFRDPDNYRLRMLLIGGGLQL